MGLETLDEHGDFGWHELLGGPFAPKPGEESSHTSGCAHVPHATSPAREGLDESFQQLLVEGSQIHPRSGKMIRGRRQRSATPQGMRTKECASISRTKNAAEACERKPRMWPCLPDRGRKRRRPLDVSQQCSAEAERLAGQPGPTAGARRLARIAAGEHSLTRQDG
jgi:hypothetical protein